MYSYTCIFMFGILNNPMSLKFFMLLLKVIVKFTYWSAGFYVAR